MNNYSYVDMMEVVDNLQLHDKSDTDLEAIARNYDAEASWKYEEVCRLEDQAHQIRKYITWRKNNDC